MKNSNKTKAKEPISRSDVKHIAKLALLSVKNAEIDKFQKQLSDIFSYVQQTRQMKTGSVNDTSQVTGKVNTFREDNIEKDRTLSQEEALSNSKKVYKGYFVVKSVFER